MVAIGLLFFAAAVGGGTALVVQNHGQGAVSVHAFNHTLALQESSLMAAGTAIAVTAVVGLALMRLGAGRARRLRHELATLRDRGVRGTQPRCIHDQQRLSQGHICFFTADQPD